MNSLISINDLDKEQIISILDNAEKIEKTKSDFSGKIMASLFFEPSTRTRLSFESAFLRLGGKVVGFSDSKTTSGAKGESLKDTIMVTQNYADIIVMRHFMNGAAMDAAEVSKIPVINAGDGSNEHPTQALIDLYTIKKTQGSITNMKIALVGDLLYGRTVHSLAPALSLFGCEIFLVSPKSLRMPDNVKKTLEDRKIKFTETEKLDEIIPYADIVYMTRIQKERFESQSDFDKVKGIYSLRKESLKKAKDTMKILHPLPRIEEIPAEIDKTRFAGYFEQASYAVRVRQAVFLYCLGMIKT